jgi:hypothetical protein
MRQLCFNEEKRKVILLGVKNLKNYSAHSSIFLV